MYCHELGQDNLKNNSTKMPSSHRVVFNNIALHLYKLSMHFKNQLFATFTEKLRVISHD